jgi:diguanylate cyclase (GGDEF)-like protein/PAS domain S-box-containing protein
MDQVPGLAVGGAQDTAAQRQAVLIQVARSLAESVEDPSRLASMIVWSIADLVGDAVTMWVLKPDGSCMECKGVAHRDPEALEMLTGIVGGMRYERGDGLLWPTVESGKPTLTPHWSLEENRGDANSQILPYMERYGVHSIVVSPVSARGRVIAVLGASRSQGSAAFTEDDVGFMQVLADLAGIALDQARLLADARAAQAELRRTAQLVDQVSDAIISTDLEWRVQSWNAAAESIYGYRAHEALGCRLDTLLATSFLEPSGAQTTGTAVREALRRYGSWSGELRECRADGKPVEVTCSMTATTDESGNPVGAVLVNRDMSENRELAAREQLSRSMLDSGDARTAVVDPDGTIVAVNAAWQAHPAPAAGCDSPGVGANYLHACDSAREECWREAGAGIREVLAGDRAVFEFDYTTEHGDEPRWFSMSVVPLADPARGAVVSHTDVTWRKRREVDLNHKAMHDPLTGLPNRRLLGEHLRQATVRANRSGTAMAVFFLDLDRFKDINDNFGHDVGDAALAGIAGRLVHAVRPSDVVTRFGGDEFVVVAEEVGDAHGATEIARRLLAACETPVPAAGRLLRVSPSIGVALSGSAGDPEDLLRAADAAMYRAKERGRGTFELFSAADRSGDSSGTPADSAARYGDRFRYAR